MRASAIIAGIIGFSGAVGCGLGAWAAWKLQMEKRRLVRKGRAPEELIRSGIEEVRKHFRGKERSFKARQKKSTVHE